MDLTFPFAEPPAPGTVIPVAPGILWARLALPFRLDHVNVYFLEGDTGWTIVDAGICDKATRAAWETLIAGPFRGARFALLGGKMLIPLLEILRILQNCIFWSCSPFFAVCFK